MVTGILGGFTTMSAVAAETSGLFTDGSWTLGVVYLLLTLGCGLGGVLIGERLSDRAHA